MVNAKAAHRYPEESTRLNRLTGGLVVVVAGTVVVVVGGNVVVVPGAVLAARIAVAACAAAQFDVGVTLTSGGT